MFAKEEDAMAVTWNSTDRTSLPKCGNNIAQFWAMAAPTSGVRNTARAAISLFFPVRRPSASIVRAVVDLSVRAHVRAPPGRRKRVWFNTQKPSSGSAGHSQEVRLLESVIHRLTARSCRCLHPCTIAATVAWPASSRETYSSQHHRGHQSTRP